MAAAATKPKSSDYQLNLATHLIFEESWDL